jgi:hypothetical protein
VAYQLVDGTTARKSYVHDGARPMVRDVMDTLAAAREADKLIQVDSLDEDLGHSMELWINPAHAVAVKVEKSEVSDMLGAVG